MVGVPICSGDTALAGEDLRATTPATATAAAPATIAEIHKTLWLPHPAPALPEAALASGASLSDCALTAPARACPFTAVMRISNGPAVWFHCMPQTAARPSLWV